MKQKVLGMMSGALMCLSLVFSSCGNVDNPLEEIGNSNPVVAQLKDAFADGAVITITFNLNGEQTITFKKGEDGYKFDGPEADNMRYHLEYENGLLVLDVRGEEATFASKIILNPKDNSFYIINKFGYNTTSNGKFSVNGVEGTLTNSCPDEAIIEYKYTIPLSTRALTRALETETVELLVYYNKAKGETWNDVINRYKNSDLSWILSSDGTYLRITNKYENTVIVKYPGGNFQVKDNQKVGVYDDPEDAENYGNDVTDKYKASWISD